MALLLIFTPSGAAASGNTGTGASTVSGPTVVGTGAGFRPIPRGMSGRSGGEGGYFEPDEMYLAKQAWLKRRLAKRRREEEEWLTLTSA